MKSFIFIANSWFANQMENKMNLEYSLLYQSYLDWKSKCEPEQYESFEVYQQKLFEEARTLSPEKRKSILKMANNP